MKSSKKTGSRASGDSLNEEMKIRVNYLMFNLANFVKEKSGYIETIRKLARKYVYKKDLIKDEIFKLLKRQGVIMDVRANHNLIPTVGRNVFARRIAGDTTYTGEVDYGAVGDGVSAFSNSSTQLNNEIFRKQAASQAFDDNIAFIEWFLAAADPAGDTFEEFGAFIDGSGAADSGQAFSLLITGGWVKSGSIFISAQYTLT